MIPRTLRMFPFRVIAWPWLWCVLATCTPTEPTPVDNLAPRPGGSISLAQGYALFVPGDTLRFTIRATDNGGLVSLGFTLRAPSTTVLDNFTVMDTVAERAIAVVVQSRWVGRVVVSATATDAVGHSAVALLDTIEVVNAARRPLSSVPLAAPVQDAVFDSARGLLYLSLPSADQVAVLDLATGMFRTPLALAGSPMGLDLSISGDSLVVAMRRTHHLAVVNLVSGAVDSALLNVPGSDGPAALRVMANGKALVVIAFDGFGFGGQVREYDFGTHAERGRSDIAFGNEAQLARSADRRRLLFARGGEAGIYRYATDDVGPVLPVYASFGAGSESADDNGLEFLIGASLFDDALELRVTLEPTGYQYGPTVLAADGRTAYMVGHRTVLRVRIPDSAVLDRVLVPFTPQRLWLSPDGTVLVAATTNPVTNEPRLWLIPQ